MVTKEIRIIDGAEREVVIEHLPTVVPERDTEYCAQTIGGGAVTSVVVMPEDDRPRWVKKAPVLPTPGDSIPPEEL